MIDIRMVEAESKYQRAKLRLRLFLIVAAGALVLLGLVAKIWMMG